MNQLKSFNFPISELIYYIENGLIIKTSSKDYHRGR